MTDEAGNPAIGTVDFLTDNRALNFSGPYYGIPLMAVIIAVILVALVVVLRYLRKPKSVQPPPPENP